jgi:hypothetical protein
MKNDPTRTALCKGIFQKRARQHLSQLCKRPYTVWPGFKRKAYVAMRWGALRGASPSLGEMDSMMRDLQKILCF